MARPTQNATPMQRFLLLLSILVSSCTLRAAAGDNIWETGIIHNIYFTFTQTGYYDSLIVSHTTGDYVRCSMVFDGVVVGDVGMKFKGNSSFNNPSLKKSMKVDVNEFDSTLDYDGIKKFNLNNGFKDPTFIREKLMLDYMRRHGMHAPRCTFARVYYNNVYWGFFTIMEEVNSKFLSQHYNNNDGNLFKGDPTGDLRWFGSSVTSYTSLYELEETTTNNWTDLVNLIDMINNTPTANYYNDLEDTLFGWDFLANMAMNNLFVNNDSYCGTGHNYYIYHDQWLGKWRWIPWDVNEAFGTFTFGMTPTQLKTLPYDYINQSNNRPLAVKMMADPTYHQVYIYTYCSFMENFTNAYLDPYIDSLANLIRPDVYADTNKFYSNSDFETNLTSDLTLVGPGGGQFLGLKGFITARRASLETQLAAFGCYVSVEENTADAQDFTLFPNPVTDFLWVSAPASWTMEEYTIEILDATGRLIQAQTIGIGTTGFSVSTGDLSPGMYILKAKKADGTLLSSRFCKSA